MRCTIRDTFPIKPATYWEMIFFSPAFLERMYREALGADRFEIVKQAGDTERGLERSMTFSQKVDAPAAVRKIFGETTLMSEQGRFDPAAGRWRFEMRPDKMTDRVCISGETHLEENEIGCDRICELDLSVKMFGIGGLVESYIARSSTRGYAEQTKFVLGFIEQNRLR